MICWPACTTDSWFARGFTNVAKALWKEPKCFLRDWRGLADDGARAETLVACHLLKAVEGWTDPGFGDFELRYLRDKRKREVDFVAVKDHRPWFLVEVKLSETSLSLSLAHFQVQTKAAHAFQLVMSLAYQSTDCFRVHRPVVGPGQDFPEPTALSKQQNGEKTSVEGPIMRVNCYQHHPRSEDSHRELTNFHRVS